MLTMHARSRRADVRNVEATTHSEPIVVEAFETNLGWMAIAWRDGALEGNVFGHASQRNAEIALARSLRMLEPKGFTASRPTSTDAPNWIKELMDGLRRFAKGEAIDFFNVPLALDHLTPFGRRVVAVCQRISWGQTRSYGELAKACRAPGAARAVGSVMAKNRFPLIVPCHRVLAAGGAIGGYSAPDGLRMKRRLLAMEQRS